ncbi:hypothetical protein D3C80_1273990 [compost metagenome]
MVASAIAAVTAEAHWLRPPTERTTAVWEVPPPAGMLPQKAPPRLASPVATSSRFGLISGSPLPTKARPAAMVSVKLISAMPAAPGNSCNTRVRSGIVRAGRPVGMLPTMATPASFRPNPHTRAMPMPTPSKGAGEWGKRHSMNTSTTRVTRATTRVSQELWGRA